VTALSITQATQLSSAAVETVKWGLYLIAVYTLFVNVLTDRRRLSWPCSPWPLAHGRRRLRLAQYARSDLDHLASVAAGFTDRNTYSACLAIMLPLTLAGGLFLPRLGARSGC